MKRLLAILLCGIIMITSVPIHIYAAGAVKPAAEERIEAADAQVAADRVAVTAASPAIIKGEPAGGGAQPSTEALEKAILAVKSKITIPAGYSEFNYYYYDGDYYGNGNWSFSWKDPKTSARIEVTSDKDNHIVYYYHYNEKNYKLGVAKYLKDELKAKADEFILKIAPDIKGKLEFIDASYEGVYSGNYIYNYQRVNSGVLLPENTVKVAVNSVTGEIVLAGIYWLYDVSVPSSKPVITKEQAAELIKKNMKMRLVYRSDYFGIYDSRGNQSTKAFLVYEPTEGYISVDAKTGEVYFVKSTSIVTDDYNKEEAAADAGNGSASAQSTLTEEEIAKIAELNKLISKEKAMDIVTGNSSLYLEDTLKAYSTTLNKIDNGNGKTNYIWTITLRDPRTVDYSKDTDTYRAYAHATVDASTGKILSFYSSMKGYYDQKTQTYKQVNVKYDKEASKKILEKFLSAQIKDRFDNSIFTEQTNGYIIYYKDDVPVYGGYSYRYNRVNENVEYPYNSIYGEVDGVTGKIYSYGSNWDESIVFESTKGAMTADKAMDFYLANEGFGLKYEINTINKYNSGVENLDSYYDYNTAYSVDYEIRLVYHPDVSPAFISPFTGEQLNYSGEVYKKEAPYAYEDVANTEANRNILLLADMNIGFEGGYFKPEQNITLGEVNTLLQKIGYGYSENDLESKKLVTKEELAFAFIKYLGLEKMSKLTGIYTTGYADEWNIGANYLGAVALAKGLDIMTGDSYNNFNAKSNITRSQAVEHIMKFITAQQQL